MATRKRVRLRTLQFEGIALRTEVEPRRVLGDIGLHGWRIESLGSRARSVLAVPKKGARITPARAWEITYRLRAHRDVERAEPAFVQPATGPYEIPPKRRAALGFAEDLPATRDCDWSLEMGHVFDAWALPLPGGGAHRGAGIVVAHPDTGYTRHPELLASDLQIAKGYDFVDDDADATDPLVPPNAGHGTGTASVIVSDEGPVDVDHVTGVAPNASLVPLRVSSSVVHFSWTRLTKALYRAIDENAHVVSMSLGGPLPSFALQEALRDAIDSGAIILAAAGNYWPFVVYPARYDETIAVAACNVERERWSGSASGRAVDITAPGESVWRAHVIAANRYDVDRSSGTSYAAAHVAGIAALWLAHHGRANLVAKYGVRNLASVFKELLLTAGHDGTPAGWPTNALGAGIANAQSLLAAPLPATVHAAGTAVRAVAPMNDIDRIAEYFPRADPARVRSWLMNLLGVDERGLNAKLAPIADELAFHVTSDRETYAQMHAMLAGRRAAAAAIVAPTNPFRRTSPTFRRALALQASVRRR